jgi:hypothetical protein
MGLRSINLFAPLPPPILSYLGREAALIGTPSWSSERATWA